MKMEIKLKKNEKNKIIKNKVKNKSKIKIKIKLKKKIVGEAISLFKIKCKLLQFIHKTVDISHSQ